MSNRYRKLITFCAIFLVLPFIVNVSYAKTYVAGTTPSSAPNAFVNTETHKVTGFMPDVARHVADAAGFDLKFKVMPFSALIQSLISGKIDMIVAGMSPTEKRDKVVDFSQPVASLGHTIFVRDDNVRTYSGPESLKGQVIGISAGTDYGAYIRKFGVAKKINYYDGLAQMMLDVKNGRISVGMTDDSILKYMAKHGELSDGLHVVTSYKAETPRAPIAFAVDEGNHDLLKKINDAINGLKKNGVLRKLQIKWGEGSIAELPGN